MRSWYISIFKYFLFILFIGYYGSISLFYHTHHIENGVIVVHSHPYFPLQDESQHEHSSDEFSVIQHLSSFLTTATWLAFPLIAPTIMPCKPLGYTQQLAFCATPSMAANGLRAPPLHTTSTSIS